MAGLFGPAEMSAVRTVVPTEQLPTALSQNQARQHVASLVGGPLGGALYGVTRWLPFAVDVVTYAVTWVMLGRHPQRPVGARAAGLASRPGNSSGRALVHLAPARSCAC